MPDHLNVSRNVRVVAALQPNLVRYKYKFERVYTIKNLCLRNSIFEISTHTLIGTYPWHFWVIIALAIIARVPQMASSGQAR